MGIQDKPFTPDVQASYLLAIAVLLDILHPEKNILELLTTIAEGIYDDVITSGGPKETEGDARNASGGSQTTADTDGQAEND